MSERILVVGGNGYIGNALVSRLSTTDFDYISVDAGLRKQWVQEVGGSNLTKNMLEQSYLVANFADYGAVANVLQWCKPTVIIHLASQPSGPYSEIDTQHRLWTQQNNITMLLNLLGAARDLGQKPKFIVTTSTGIPGAPGEPITEEPMANQAGSAYHVSRGLDSANLSLAARQWGFNIVELRTSIVYGVRISNFVQPVARFDWDNFFGTVVHRFVLRKKLNLTATIYGKGLQMKPIISLDDCVESIMLSIDYEAKGHEIMNQTTQVMSILEMAQSVGVDVQHIENPRAEKEDYQMDMRTEKFDKLMRGYKTTKLPEATAQLLKDIDTSLLPANWELAYSGKLPQMHMVA